jgi:protein-disulfide isomerase
VNRSRRDAPQGRSPAGFYALLAALALAGIAILVYLVRRPRDVSIPANVAVLAEDTAGFRGYVLGSDSALVEVTEYADYQCPACQNFAMVQWPSVRRSLIETGRLRWRFRDFPLDEIHRHARLAAHAAACAAEQDKYWEVQERIFETHGQWSGAASAGPVFRSAASSLGLDLDRYDGCMESARYAARIEASRQEGIKLGVPSTPTFLIDGRLYPGAISSDSIAALVRNLGENAGS